MKKYQACLVIVASLAVVSMGIAQEKPSPPTPPPASPPAALPTSPPGQETTVKANSVVISIPSDGEFYLGKTKIAEADIPEKLKGALKDKSPDEEVVYIKAAADVSYGSVVSVIDAIRAAGFYSIGLVADKKKRPDLKPKLSENESAGLNVATSEHYPAPIQIEMMSKTRLKLNSKPILLSQLGSRLQKLLAVRSNKTVFIQAPRKMSYGDVVKVIDLVKGVGAAPVGLQTEPP